MDNPRLHKKDTGSAGLDIREVGHVSSVKKFIVNVAGLASCINGQVVEFQNGGVGMVMGFNADTAQVLLLGSDISVRAGDEVYNKAQSLRLPVSESFLGRVINSLCEPADGLGPVESAEYSPVFSDAPGVMDRMPVHETLETGTLSIDAVMPIARGQRQLLIGDRLTGKTSVALDAIISQKNTGVICIYACVGKPFSSLRKVLNVFREYQISDYVIVINGSSSVSVGEQYLAPYTAAMLGEYFMSKGIHVLVVFDDLTKHAWIYRQISLLLERAPGREAYPGDIFYIHSQLVERAGCMKKELKGGSMTFLPIIETLQGDLTGYIPTNMISMTDGQIYFDTSLFHQGIKPPVHFGLSVSRIGNRAQWPGLKAVSKTLRFDYIQYQELLHMTRLRASELSKQARLKLGRGEALTNLLVQEKNKPVPIESQIVHLFALNRGMLDALSAQEIKRFKLEIVGHITSMHPTLMREIREKQTLDSTALEKLVEALQAYFSARKGA